MTLWHQTLRRLATEATRGQQVLILAVGLGTDTVSLSSTRPHTNLKQKTSSHLLELLLIQRTFSIDV